MSYFFILTANSLIACTLRVVAKERSFIERASSKVSIKNLGDKIQLVPQVARWNDETKVLNVDVQVS